MLDAAPGSPQTPAVAPAYANVDKSIRGTLLRMLGELLSEKDSKRLFFFVCVIIVFDTLELVHAVQVNSLGLMSDGFHMAFHALGMVAALAGMVLSRAPPSFEMSYGLDRVEVLASFTAATCLLFVCLFLMVQAFHRVLNPEEPVDSSHTLEFGVGGVVLNVIGMFVFGLPMKWVSVLRPLRHHALNSPSRRIAQSAVHGSSGSTGPQVLSSHAVLGAHQGNMQAVYLHLVSDLLSSVSVVVSSLLVQAGWPSMDAVQSLAIVGLTMYNVAPLLKSTGLILLQSRPAHLKAALDRCRREAAAVDGVLEVNDEHYWSQSPGVVVATLCVRVRANADEQAILGVVHRIFSKHVTYLTVQCEKDPPLDWLLPGQGATGSAPTSAH